MPIRRRQFAKQTALIGRISLILCTFASPASADQPPDPEVQKNASTIIQAMLKEREKFKSGVAEISGTKLVQVTGQPDINGPITGLYAFKLDGNKLRFDNEEPHAIIRDNVKPILMRRRFCFLRNPEYSARWRHEDFGSHSSIFIAAPAEEPLGGYLARSHHIHAMRSAGLIDYIDFDMGRSVDEVVKALLPYGLTKVVQEQRQTVLHWRLGDGGEKGTRRLVIETHEGYRPVELIVTSKNNPAKSVTRTKWQKLGGTDVPVEMTIDWDYTDANSRRHSHYTLKYDWKKSVNKPVNPAHFDFRSFRDIPGDGSVSVIDQRRGTSNLSGIWKGNGIVEGRENP